MDWWRAAGSIGILSGDKTAVGALTAHHRVLLAKENRKARKTTSGAKA
jgi:hypothetical protein